MHNAKTAIFFPTQVYYYTAEKFLALMTLNVIPYLNTLFF